MLAEIDLMIRGAVIGISLLTFLILASTARTRRKSLSLGALSVTVAGMMAKDQGISAAWGSGATDPALFVVQFMPLALTWFVLDIFLEREERRTLGRGPLALAVLTVAACMVGGHEGPLLMVMQLTLYAWLLVVVMLTAPGDLVEHRRSFRNVFMIAVTLFAITKTVVYAATNPATQPDWMPTAFALGMLGFEVVFAYWALRPGGSLWSTEEAPAPRQAAAGADPVDAHLLAKIDKAMAEELWRREGLTIGEMAEELQVPEHRLRHAINRDLGFRNFPGFINSYRINAAKAALAAPENAQKTILEIAYDVGFASLGPFNKAFRAMTGTSPRDYRRNAVEDASIPA